MSTVYLYSQLSAIATAGMPEAAKEYFESVLSETVESAVYRGVQGVFYAEKAGKLSANAELERMRKAGNKLCNLLHADKAKKLGIHNLDCAAEYALAFAEGVLLTNYRFDKYVADDSGRIMLEEVALMGEGSDGLPELKKIAKAVFKARDLVNEPVNRLNAEGLAAAFEEMGNEAGFSVEVWNEARIQSQKMGGLLSVNAGSQEPPTFSIMEYKPQNAVNTKPIVLVGKGVVFDTGGLSLKPTPQSMDQMKCDMAGSATVSATIYAAATLQLPIWLVCLVPATDNRPGENATCPGDIITMYDGTTVEVLNTDAEGRLILADALAFAKKYDPELVMDFATLTGAAHRALGSYGSALMGNAGDEVKTKIMAAGEKTYERLAELPLWEEYFNDTKGEISDLKNLGKAEGGAQSAAMFLRHFTSYPWLHFDIAGTAFLTGTDAYRPKGGTGVGVRMLVEFLKSRING